MIVVVGRVTSGGYGYTVGKSIAYAYLPAAAAETEQLGLHNIENIVGRPTWAAASMITSRILPRILLVTEC